MINYYDLLFDKCFICDNPTLITGPNSFGHTHDNHTFCSEINYFGVIFELSFLNPLNKYEIYYIFISPVIYSINSNQKLIYKLRRDLNTKNKDFFNVPLLKSIQDIENFIILI